MARVDDYLLNRSASFPLGATQEDRTDLKLMQSAAANGRVRGTATNSVDGLPVANAAIKIRTQSGDPIAHTQTNSAGNYIIEGLTPGTYTVNAAQQGFLTTAGQTFTILGGQTLDMDISITPISGINNTIFGSVTNLATDNPIDGANVVLIQGPGIGENAVAVKSNASGEYLLEGIPDGTRTLIAHLGGYYMSSFIPITISGGVIVNADIALQPDEFPQATVNGYITQQDGTPIENACVGLYLLNISGIEILQQVTFTDSTGFYIFGRATAGNYVVKAKSEKLVSTP